MMENAISSSSLYNPGSTLNYSQAAMMGLSGSHGGLQDPQQLGYTGHSGIPNIILTGEVWGGRHEKYPHRPSCLPDKGIGLRLASSTGWGTEGPLQAQQGFYPSGSHHPGLCPDRSPSSHTALLASAVSAHTALVPTPQLPPHGPLCHTSHLYSVLCPDLTYSCAPSPSSLLASRGIESSHILCPHLQPGRLATHWPSVQDRADQISTQWSLSVTCWQNPEPAYPRDRPFHPAESSMARPHSV